MTVFVLILAALAGGFLRLLYGGAPHRSDPAAPGDLTRQLPGWADKTMTVPTMLLIGTFLLPWYGILAPLIVSAVLAWGWSMTHGAYLSPGAGKPDTRQLQYVVRPIGRVFGWTDGSVGYCCLGMGIRYGAQTGLVALAMAGTNAWLHTDYGLWYGAVGLLAGPAMLGCWAAGWRWVTPALQPWLGPVYNNGPFEFAVGALLYAPLVLV